MYIFIRKFTKVRSVADAARRVLPSFISYPRGRLPPTQIPFRLDAAILSRIRSEVTSRSNWATQLAKADTAFQAHPLVNRLNLA